jgi:CHAT domain
MTSESNVKLTIHFNDPDLDAEERDEASRKLLVQLRDLDEVESVERVLDPNPPQGNKAFGGFLTGVLRTETKPTNLQPLFGFLGSRPGYTPIEMEVEVNGRKLKLKAANREELMAAWQMVQQFMQEPGPAAPTRTILILAANPRNTLPLRLDQEIREITAGLERAKYRDRFHLQALMAVRPRDFQRAMLDHHPQIVHFCGHGEGTISTVDLGLPPEQRTLTPVGSHPASPKQLPPEGLAFEDEMGQTKLVDAASLAGLFKLFADQVECVVLNACYSQVQAKAIAQHIPYVIGMNRAIGDKAAIEFAVGFYDAIGAGRSVEFAYELACSAIRVAGIPEHLTPVLEKQPSLS